MIKKKLIALDIETTGFNKNNFKKKIDYNHFIIEIGAVEICDGIITNNYFHTYIKPPRIIDIEAYKIHNITNDFLKDKPSFKEKLNEFLYFIKNSILIIHNAYFDLSFLNKEINLNRPKLKKKFNIQKKNNIIDTLFIAKNKFPSKSNSLKSLVNRFKINLFNCRLHGALVDAFILAKLYLKLTIGQKSYLKLDNLLSDIKIFNKYKKNDNYIIKEENKLKLIKYINIKKYELKNHLKMLKFIYKNDNKLFW